MLKKSLLLLSILLILTSCIFTGSEDDGEKKEKGVYPDMRMEEATFTIAQGGDKPIRLQSRSIVFYSKDNYAELEGFIFTQEDADGNVILSGSADKGKVDIGRNIIDFSGNVSFSKVDDGMHVAADNLYFDADANEISAEGRVVVESREGMFQGTGFRGDLAYSTYTFETIEKGELRNE